MKKPRPIWEDLPRHLKIYIAEKLGVKSRSSLAQCSKSDLEIVQAIPYNLKSITIGSSDMISSCFDVGIHSYQSKKMIMEAKTAISSFLNIFKNPKSKVDLVTFNLGEDMFYSILISELKTQKIKIRSRNYRIYRSEYFTDLTLIHLELLEFFDSKLLETIHIIPIVADEFLEKLVRTEQWKSLNRADMCIEYCEKVNFEDFFHLNKLFLKGTNVWHNKHKKKILKNFQSRDFPVNSFFYLTDIRWRSRIDSETNPSEHELDMPTSENKLHIKLFPTKIQARVISKTREEDNLEIDKLLYSS